MGIETNSNCGITKNVSSVDRVCKICSRLREKCCKLKKGCLIASIKLNSCNSLSDLFPSTADSRQERSPTNQKIHCWIRLRSHPGCFREWRYQLRKSIIRDCLMLQNYLFENNACSRNHFIGSFASKKSDLRQDLFKTHFLCKVLLASKLF